MQLGQAIEANAVRRPAASPAAASVIDDVVAVVDDDPLLLRTMVANLEEAGYRAVAFATGAAVLDYFAEGGSATALLLDWSMPVMDGPAVLQQLRARGHSLPVIYLTGYTQPVFEEAALAGGAVDFVDKSRSFAVVLLRLKLAIAGGQARRGRPAAANEDGIHCDDESARIYWRRTLVDLTLSEFKIVRFLVAQAGRDVSYRSIYDQVRGEGFQAGAGENGYRMNVRAMVKRIRQAFRDVDPGFDMIRNYAGFGYRWGPAIAA